MIMNECWGCLNLCLLGRCWLPFERMISLFGWMLSGRNISSFSILGLLCLMLAPSRGIGERCPRLGLCRLLYALLVIYAGSLYQNHIRLFWNTFLGRLVSFYDFLRNILTPRFFYVFYLMFKILNSNESYSEFAFLI